MKVFSKSFSYLLLRGNFRNAKDKQKMVLFYDCTFISVHLAFVDFVRLSDYNYDDKVYRKDGLNMEYMSCPEAAEKWDISERRVQILCKENRIPGVSKIGYMWLIPKDAKKPDDGRRKLNRQQTKTEIL